MTRATIGGINSQDQIWYPLDVNAAGQARIDTSGIPVPMEWETGTWTPEYISTAGANWATITYGFQSGHWYRLGILCWFTCAISTTELFVNITTGSIRLTGLPFTWENYGSNNSGAAASFGVINYGRTFETSVPVSFALANTDGDIKMWRPTGTYPVNSFAALEPSDFRQGAVNNANQVQFSGWGVVTS